jgi:Tfp pilus assembly protein PilE
MANRAPVPAPNDSTLVTWLAATVVILVGALLAGGYWMQAQKEDRAALRQQAQVYENYLRNTRPVTPSPTSTEQARTARSEAQATRQYLLAHPAVTPGPGFEQRGVQATGKAIVQAIDQAQGL